MSYLLYCQGWSSRPPASVGRVHQEGEEEGHKERSDGEGGGEEGGGGLWLRLAWPPHPSPDGQVGWKHCQVSPSLTFSSPDTSPASPPPISPPASRISQMGNSNKVPSQSSPLSSSSTSSSSGRLRSPCLAVAKLRKSPCGRSESQPKQSQVFFLSDPSPIIGYACH